MANPEHLEILKQGVEIWNQWRKDNPKVIPDLNEVDIEEADLSRANLSRANLSGANLGGANLTWADLSWADLSWANLRKADLGWADISGARLYEANLSKAELHNADLSWADINETDLSEADTNKTIFGGKDLSGVDLSGADLSGRALSRANLSGANLSETKLYKVNLSEANLSRANLRGAFLKDANLNRVSLSGANLGGANLAGADLSEATLSGADLSNANLSNATLSNATLSSADLSKAILEWADLKGADLSNADLSDALLDWADLSWASCYKANLSRASLGVTRLIDTNFDGATLTGADLWETQRAQWSIKDVICEYVYWDEHNKEKSFYNLGEFERLFAEKTKVRLFYKDGISPLEIATIPALIKHLEDSYPGSGLRLVSIKEDSGGVVAELAIEGVDNKTPEQVQQLKTTLEAEAQQRVQYQRQALVEREARLQLEGEVKQLNSVVDKLILRQSIIVNQGDVTMGNETYQNYGQVGAQGQNAHANDMIFNQVVNHFEKSFDLRAVAKQLGEVREEMATRQDSSPQAVIAQGEAAKAEMAAHAGDTSKVVEYLKAGGQVLLDVAKETGKELLTAAIKASMGMP